MHQRSPQPEIIRIANARETQCTITSITLNHICACLAKSYDFIFAFQPHAYCENNVISNILYQKSQTHLTTKIPTLFSYTIIVSLRELHQRLHRIVKHTLLLGTHNYKKNTVRIGKHCILLWIFDVWMDMHRFDVPNISK